MTKMRPAIIAVGLSLIAGSAIAETKVAARDRSPGSAPSMRNSASPLLGFPSAAVSSTGCRSAIGSLARPCGRKLSSRQVQRC